MQKVILDLIPGGVAPIAYASQYDDGRVIRFMLTEGGPDIYILSASEVITCNLTKPDGTETVIDVANPGAGKNYVDLVNGADDYDQEGVYSGEIVLTRNSTVQGTANFILKVEADAYDGQVTTDTATGTPCTFDTDLADNLVSLKANIVASGGYDADTQTAHPIVGYSELNLVRCGVNLLPKGESESEYGITATVNDDGTIKITGTATNDFWLQIFTTLPAGTYTISGCPSGGSASTYRLDARDFTTTVVDTGNGATFTTTETKTGYALIRIQSGYACPVDGLLFKPQIVKGSSALPYAPYNGTPYLVQFGQTVYGGVLDVTRGKLTNSMPNKPALNDLAWDKSSRGMFYTYDLASTIKRPTSQSVIGNIMCEICPTDTAGNVYAKNQGIAINTDGAIWLFLTDYENKTVAELLTDLGTYCLSYELATPIDIDLTPVQISALVGTNNITSDLGGDVNVTYIKKV